MMSFQQFLDEKAKPPGSYTKANSPARLFARGCPRPAGPARPKYTGLSVSTVYPIAKMRG